MTAEHKQTSSSSTQCTEHHKGFEQGYMILYSIYKVMMLLFQHSCIAAGIQININIMRYASQTQDTVSVSKKKQRQGHIKIRFVMKDFKYNCSRQRDSIAPPGAAGEAMLSISIMIKEI